MTVKWSKVSKMVAVKWSKVSKNSKMVTDQSLEPIAAAGRQRGQIQRLSGQGIEPVGSSRLNAIFG